MILQRVEGESKHSGPQEQRHSFIQHEDHLVLQPGGQWRADDGRGCGSTSYGAGGECRGRGWEVGQGSMREGIRDSVIFNTISLRRFIC